MYLFHTASATRGAGGLELGILVVVGFLFGIILGQFFKCYILVPAYALAIVLVLASPVHMDNNLLGSFLQLLMLNVSLQVGYVAGGILFASCTTQNLHFDEISSGLAETRERERRAP
jgi:uncharacterized membrane protein YbjE (DUF340 family)